MKKQYFSGSQTKFEKGLADQGYTRATLEEDIRSQLLTEGIYKKVTGDVKITDADVKSYYDKNRRNYTVPESRSVRHILVKTKAEADRIRAELVGGGDFAALAKANSIDPGSKDAGGKLVVSRGQTVAPFDKAAFSLEDRRAVAAGQDAVRLPPDPAARRRQAGLGHAVRAGQGPDPHAARVRRKNAAVNTWVSDVEKQYKSKVQYAAGFEPPDTSTTTGETTTSG